jgi:hypothetical protein
MKFEPKRLCFGGKTMSKDDPAADRNARADRIMARIRTATGLRDIMAFGIGRFWLVLLELFAVLYKSVNRGKTDAHRRGPGSESSTLV